MRRPTIKNVALLLISFAFIGGAFFFAEYKNNKTEQTIYISSADKAVSQITADVSEKDSDGDGLKDWEEILWNTDPHKKDTDGNGVGDKIDAAKAASKKSESVVNNPLAPAQKANSKTQEFAKKFFTNFIELRKSGDISNEFAVENFANEAASTILADSAKETYSIQNLKIFPDTDMESVKRYGNSFAEIWNRYQRQYLQNQIILPTSEADFSNEAYIKSYENAATLYKNMATELSKIPVPQSLAQNHVGILNSYHESFRGLWALSTTEKDPMSAIKGLSLHVNASSKEKVAFQTISSNLKARGIYFAASEPGIFWNTLNYENN